MSKKTGIAFLVMFVIVAVLVAGGIFAFRKAENTPVSSASGKGSGPEVKTEPAAQVVEEVVAESVAESVEAVPEEPVAEIAEEAPAEESVASVAEEAVEVVEPAERPAPQRRPGRNVTEGLGGMMPMMGGNGGTLPTKEEAVEAAREILTRYREASPEEKQQMVMGIVMVQGVISGLSQNAGALLQQMPAEQRERIVNSAATSVELLDAVQEEFAASATPEEIQIFGGLFQSLRNVNDALSNAAQTQF